MGLRLDVTESTSLSTTVLGAVGAWMLTNPGGVVGAVAAVISCLVLVLRYREESRLRKADLEIKQMQLNELKAAKERRDAL